MVRQTYSNDESVSILIAHFWTGVLRDGGYSEFVILRDEAVVPVPKDMDPTQAAPMLCAAVTCFSKPI